MLNLLYFYVNNDVEYNYVSNKQFYFEVSLLIGEIKSFYTQQCNTKNKLF